MVSVNFQLSERFRIRIRRGPNPFGQSTIYCKRITVNIAYILFATLGYDYKNQLIQKQKHLQ